MNSAPLVMLIDDNDIDLLLNKKFLHIAGISDNTVSFMTAKKAIEYFETNAGNKEMMPDIILLDIQMPEINGFQLLEILKDKPDLIPMGTKIFLLSSTTDPIDIDRARGNERVADILMKPLDPAKLKEILLDGVMKG